MRTLKRNKRGFYYALFDKIDTLYDEYGNETGEHPATYKEPVYMEANISPATGQSNVEMFGNLDSYDKVIVTDDMSCPIDENTVLFVDAPVCHLFSPSDHDGVITEDDYVFCDNFRPFVDSQYDYVVKRVAKSLNSISIAIRKVNVS